MTLIVVPAYNEAESLPFVVDELRRLAAGCEILVVDDASCDGTQALLPSLGVHRLRLRVRLGVGGAIRAGLRWAESQGFHRVVRVDGDGQHRAEDVARFLRELDAGADAVIGSRYLGAPAGPGDDRSFRRSGVRRHAQVALAKLLTIWTRRTLTDPTSGFWAFGPRAVRILARHHPTGYPEPELLLFLCRNGLDVREVPVVMRPRVAGRTSLTPRRELVALARVLLALVIVPLRGEETTP